MVVWPGVRQQKHCQDLRKNCDWGEWTSVHGLLRNSCSTVRLTHKKFQIFTFFMVYWILTDVMNFCIYHIFKFRQTQKCPRCQLCVLRENSNQAINKCYEYGEVSFLSAIIIYYRNFSKPQSYLSQNIIQQGLGNTFGFCLKITIKTYLSLPRVLYVQSCARLRKKGRDVYRFGNVRKRYHFRTASCLIFTNHAQSMGEAIFSQVFIWEVVYVLSWSYLGEVTVTLPHLYPRLHLV